MKSLSRKFYLVQARHEDWGTIPCFNEAIKGQGFSHRTINQNFSALVDKDDFDKHEKPLILDYMYSLTIPQSA